MLRPSTMRGPLPVVLLTTTLLGAPACSSDEPAGSPDAAVGGPADAAPPPADFRRFTRVFGGGPCPADTDCTGSIEVRQNGRLLVDRLGEFPAEVHEATITAGELDEIVAIVTDPDLVALLDLRHPPCPEVADAWDEMTLVDDDASHDNVVTFCDDDPIVAARAALDDLAAAYVP
jgi:hypothetical protein